MKEEKVGKFNKKRTIKRDIASSNRSFLLFHDRYLTYLKEKKSNIFDSYIDKIISKYKSETNNTYVYIENLDIEPIKNKLKWLLNNPELIKACINLHLSLMKIPPNYYWEPKELSLYHIDVDRANYAPRYFAFKILIELIDRKEAIQFLKEFTNYYVNNYREVSNYDNLKTIYEDDIERGKKTDSSIYTVALINEGKYVGKCEKCMGHESLKDLEDKEITEIVLCYGDYALIKNMNEHFLATRTITLNTGPYCDLCVHDTRIVNEIEHPSREFYDNLEN
ncbi:MAG: hypothetical protein FK730_14740 [Asgard group archaeon]|nr:hypothetical protein [Asgard group archaeon]